MNPSPAAPRAWRPWQVSVLLAVSSVAVTLLVLEVGLRMVRSTRGGGKEGREELAYTEYDPLLGWRKVAGARARYTRREYDVEVTINSLGLRDPERAHAADPGTFRVLGLGDSFVEGYTVPLAQTVTQVLEGRLRAAGCGRAEVLNGGTAAYSTDQEYLFYRSEGKRYRSGVVLLFFYYNDVVYNDLQVYSSRPKPVFEMAEQGIALHRYPVRHSPPALARKESERPVRSGSALVGWVRERLWNGAPRLHDLMAGTGLWAPIQPRPARLELRVYETRRVPEIEDAWDKTAAILRALRDEVQGDGARLAVAYVPSRMEVHDKSWELTRRLYGMKPGGWDRGRVIARLKHLGAQQGYPVVDLTRALREADAGLFGRPYFDHDGHWTARGHAAVASKLHVFLAEQGWLPARCGAPAN